MQPRNRLTQYLTDDTSRTRAVDDAIRHLDPRKEVEKHVVKVRRSVALLLRSLGDIERDEEPLDEAAVVESCLGCADALEDLLVFLFPRNKAEAETESEDDEAEQA